MISLPAQVNNRSPSGSNPKPNAKRRRLGIRSRFLTYFSLALVLPTLTTVGMVYVTIHSALRESSVRENRELSRRLAERISTQFENTHRALASLRSQLSAPPLRPEMQQATLRKFLARFPEMLDAGTFDARGKETAFAIRGNVRPSPTKNSVFGRKEFVVATSGRTFYGSPFLGADGTPQITLATPSGLGRGAVIAHLSLKNIGTLVDESANPVTRPFVVDNLGTILPSPTESRPTKDHPAIQIFLADRANAQGQPLDLESPSGRTLSVFHTVPIVGWAVFAESRHDQLWAPIRRMGRRVALITLLLVVLFWGLGYSLVKEFLEPLDVLQQGLQRIGRGELSHRIELHTGDELERVAETVNHMALSLEETERTKSDLTHMIVHDLKNPLSATLGSIECVLQMSEATLSPDQKKMLTLGAKSGRDLLRLIQNLLDLAKMENGRLEIHPEDFSLLELAGHCIDDLEPQIARENKVISVEVHQRLPSARADRDLVHRVLANLLTNALKHTPPRTEISIHLRLNETSDTFIVSVKDTGEGVPPDFKDRIFEKFSQAEGRKKNQRVGSGLGLTFCKMAVEAQGGRIWVESEPGRGSEFFFTLPLLPAPPPPLSSATAPTK